MSFLQYIIPAVALIIVQLIISFKQDRHNQLIERMTVVEQNDVAQWKWIDQFKEVFKNHISKEV